MTEPVLSKLEQRLGGRVYARQRLKIETDREAQVFGQGLFNFFHIGNWYPIHSVIRILLKLTGMREGSLPTAASRRHSCRHENR